MSFVRLTRGVALGSALALALGACAFTSDYGDTVYLEGAPCTSGHERPCGASIGECKAGEQMCEQGQWSACSGVGPAVEVCDGLDNDCDGEPDQNCECVQGATRPCGTDVGSCEVGQQPCVKGFWEACSGRGPESETCNGADDDCDGGTDEGCECVAGATRPCGSSAGRCAEWRQTCVEGSWSACTDDVATTELCNELDDDCDGEVDEGFRLGESCSLAAGCVGIRVCSDGHQGAECVVDPTAITAEVCDGVDNDCDGYIDYWLGATRLISACECVEQRLPFGPNPIDASLSGDGLFCNGATECDGADGELSMSFCLTCDKRPWAMCVSEKPVNLEPLVNGADARALRVRYSFESDEPAKTLVNLYYSIDRGEGAEKQTFRRYYRLLGTGDAPGTYSHVLSPGHGCFGAPFVAKGQKPIDCKGSNDQCPGCRDGDTCGPATGKDCSALNFAAAQLQVAADWLPCDGEFRGVVRIHELSYGPLVCEAP